MAESFKNMKSVQDKWSQERTHSRLGAPPSNYTLQHRHELEMNFEPEAQHFTGCLSEGVRCLKFKYNSQRPASVRGPPPPPRPPDEAPPAFQSLALLPDSDPPPPSICLASLRRHAQHCLTDKTDI